jgi:hypothetical protein
VAWCDARCKSERAREREREERRGEENGREDGRCLTRFFSQAGGAKQTFSGSYLPIMGMEGASFSRPNDILSLSESMKIPKSGVFRCLIHLPLPASKTMHTLLAGNDERIVVGTRESERERERERKGDDGD